MIKFKREAAAEIIAGIVRGQYEAAKNGVLVIWTIYDRPADHPQGFIARRFDIRAEGPKATDLTIAAELEDLRAGFWKAGLMKLSRQDGDEPQIVESWV
jgi:hypothetical protein